jgi:hypothetical protein
MVLRKIASRFVPRGMGKRPICSLAVVLSAAAIAGCAQMTDTNPVNSEPSAPIQVGQLIGGGTKQITQEVQPSIGFLPHPELLAPGGQGKAVLAYLNPKVNMAVYRRVLLEPVVLRAAQSSSFNGVPTEQQQALANDLYAYLYNALNSHCQLVTTASPGTMRMRFALVDATKPDTLINTVATYAPYWSTGYTATSLVFNKGVGFFAGTATGEGFAVDAASGALLWEVVDKRVGTTAFVANTLDSWRDVHNVFEAWGTQLVARLRELGVCQA